MERISLLRGALGLLAVTALPALAQNGASVTVRTNGHAIIKTIIVTNGGSYSYSSSSSSDDPDTPVEFHSSNSGQPGGMIDPHELMKSFKARHQGAPASTNPVTWLGVATDEVSEELRAHLPLPESAGLVVRDVTRDSPAAVAGLQANDILTKLDDQLLVNPSQLQALIRGRKDGDQVTLTVLRKGQETKIKTKLAQKVPGPADDGTPQVLDLGSFDLDMGKVFGQLGSNGGPVVFQRSFTSSATNMIDSEELQKNVQKAIDDAMKQMRREMEKAGVKHPGK